MRLTELEPRWLNIGGRSGMGITFLCPCCRSERLPILFENPLDGGAPEAGVRTRWTRTGNTFETLTLTPSIDARNSGHFHGFITAGEIVIV